MKWAKNIGFLILFTCTLILTACDQKAPTWQEQYDLGVRYLSEGNYAEAILAFTAAIEIDEKRIEAYFGLADTYVASGNTVQAEQLLKECYERLGDDRVAEKMNELAMQPIPGEVARTERVERNDGGYSIYEYDAADRTIKITVYNADGSVHYIQNNTFDSSGNQTGGTREFASGYTYAFKQDEIGRTVWATYGNPPNGVMEEYQYNGDTVKIVFDDGINGSFANTYTLSDANNSVIIEKRHNEYVGAAMTYVAQITERDVSGSTIRSSSITLSQ